MRLNPNEYVIKRLGDLETITITKEALEKWRDHYATLEKKYSKKERDRSEWMAAMYYAGRRETVEDLLKHFEEEG